MYRIFAICIASAVIVGCSTAPDTDPDPTAVAPEIRELPIHAVGPVALVDDEPVGPDAFNELAEAEFDRMPEEQRLRTRIGELADGILDTVVELHLVERTLEEAQITVDDESIDRELDYQRRHFGGEDGLKQHLEIINISEDQFRQDLKRSLRVQKYLVDNGELVLEFSDEQLAEYLQENRLEYYEEEQVVATEVVFEWDNDEQREVAHEYAERLAGNAEGHEELVELAQEILATEEVQGGIQKSATTTAMTTDAELKDAVFDELEVGQISAPLSGSSGIHVIKKLDHSGGPPDVDDVRDELKADLRFEKRASAHRDFVEQLLDDADIELVETNIVVEADEK